MTKKINYPVENGYCTMFFPVTRAHFVGSASCRTKCKKWDSLDQKGNTIGCKPLNKKLQDDDTKTL